MRRETPDRKAAVAGAMPVAGGFSRSVVTSSVKTRWLRSAVNSCDDHVPPLGSVAVVLLMEVLETVLMTLCVVDLVEVLLTNITELELVLLLLEIIFKVERIHTDIMVEVKDLVVLVEHASQTMEEMQELVAGVQKIKVMM